MKDRGADNHRQYLPVPLENINSNANICEGKVVTAAMHYVDTNSVQKGIDSKDVYIPSPATIQGIPRVFIGNITNKSDLRNSRPYATANLSQQGDYAQAIFNISSECNSKDASGRPALGLTLDYDGGKDNQTYPLIVSNKGNKIHIEGVAVTDANIINQILRQGEIKSVGTKIDEIVKRITGKELEGADKYRVTAQEARKALEDYYLRIATPQPATQSRPTNTSVSVINTTTEKTNIPEAKITPIVRQTLTPIIDVSNSYNRPGFTSIPTIGLTEIVVAAIGLYVINIATKGGVSRGFRKIIRLPADDSKKDKSHTTKHSPKHSAGH